MKLGSLFDGIGGFPYSASKYGFEPVWASEIEPFPIKVTQCHFLDMKHLGDITQINGASIEPVDVITFGSPCQDLSVAGKREGLAGERSGLFMEAVRIIREMRRATGGKYPRFAVWENVPGAFSSHGGQDFRAVLEEIGNAQIPMPKSGKWATAGMVRTETADIAWRTLDAQHHGVPQRRRRIFLVADFRGQCAGEILFVESCLRGNPAESGEPGQEVAGDAGTGIDMPIWDIGDRRRVLESINVAPSLLSKMGTGGNNVPIMLAFGPGGQHEVSHAIRSQPSKADKPDSTTYVIQNATRGKSQNGLGVSQDDVNYTLDSLGNHAVCIQGSMIGRADKNGPQGDGINEEVSFTLNTTDRHAVATYRDGGQISDCLDCSMLAKGQMMPEKRRFPAVLEPQLYDMTHADEVMRPVEKGIAPTLNSRMGTGGNQVPVMMAQQAVAIAFNGRQDPISGEITGALDTCSPQAQCVAYPDPANTLLAKANLSFRSDQDTLVAGLDCRNGKENGDLCGTLQAKANGGFSYNCTHPVRIGYAVRRLTPIECLRLQGYPDWWLDIEGMSDSAKYKAIGNSVAIPCVDFVMSGIARVMGRRAVT